MSEACRGEGGRVWVPKKIGDTRDPRDIPEEERFFFLEEWSMKAIAEVIDVPVGTVKSRLYHARRQLRRFALARPSEAERR